MHRFAVSLRLYSSQAAVKKSPLAVLRGKTGFPIAKCKEALIQHDNDLQLAEKWLDSQAQKEGWTKVEKLKGRAANQGLIGVLVRGNNAAMTEVNCETDFVARNEKFQSLVATITTATLEQYTPRVLTATDMPSTDHLTQDVVSQIVVSKSNADTKKLADLIAEVVGRVSENIIISRGCTFGASKGLICSYVYNQVCSPETNVAMGTYAAVLHLLPQNGDKFDDDETAISALGRQICQHVVGMNPSTVLPSGTTEVGDSGGALVDQNFVLQDGSVTVGELLHRKGAKVTKFVRYALGEEASVELGK